jgi:hypothetical protein
MCWQQYKVQTEIHNKFTRIFMQQQQLNRRGLWQEQISKRPTARTTTRKFVMQKIPFWCTHNTTKSCTLKNGTTKLCLSTTYNEQNAFFSVEKVLQAPLKTRFLGSNPLPYGQDEPMNDEQEKEISKEFGQSIEDNDYRFRALWLLIYFH